MKRAYVTRHPESHASPEMPLRDRLRLKASVSESGCWIFKGAPQGTGYAQLRWNGRLGLVHRLSYEAFVGPIPAGMQIDHLCRVRLCFNPEHLEPVTAKENIRRGWVVRRAANQQESA